LPPHFVAATPERSATHGLAQYVVGERHDWNISAVARELDLARSHIYNQIRAFGLTPGGSKK
jgi:transcriptional regulator of acetoin/glycerol metabolism